MAFWLFCWTRVLCEDWLMMLAWPDTTVAPVGLAAAGWTSVTADTRQLVAIRPARKRIACFSSRNGKSAPLPRLIQPTPYPN
jgi:hypothetical protein